MHRRRLLGGGLLAAVAGLGGCALALQPETGRPLSRPLPPPEGAPPFGAERVLGMLELDARRLGGEGLSGLHISDDLHLTAIGDRGAWCHARLVLDERGVPLRLEAPRAGRLHDARWRALPVPFSADAESLARLPDGSWLVGFERWHRIWRYRDLNGPAEPVGAPPGLEEAPLNGGLESLAVLADGRWLAIAEKYHADEAGALRHAWIGGPGGWQALAYRPAPGFDPSDACPLPDGGALVLERHFSWLDGLRGRLCHIPAGRLARAGAGSVLEGDALLDLADPLPTDNWEGVSVFHHRGQRLAALISDDNGLAIQRTLLMVIRL